MLHAAEGHRRPGRIRAALAAVNLDADGLYHAVRARPQPTIDMETIERYLGADGLVRRGNGLCAMLDETRAGFIAHLPNAAAPTPVGVSEAVAPSPVARSDRPRAPRSPVQEVEALVAWPLSWSADSGGPVGAMIG